jgi:hypothetical protein
MNDFPVCILKRKCQPHLRLVRAVCVEPCGMRFFVVLELIVACRKNGQNKRDADSSYFFQE